LKFLWVFAHYANLWLISALSPVPALQHQYGGYLMDVVASLNLSALDFLVVKCQMVQKFLILDG